MYETEYLKLKVAEENDFYNINEHAGNLEIIDAKFKEIGNEDTVKSALLDLIHPIGSIYTSTDSISPQNLFGGIWQQIEDMFLLAAGKKYKAGETGGEAEHTLGASEMPVHGHGYSGTTGNDNNDHTHGFSANTGTVSADHAHTGNTSTNGSHTHQAYYKTGGVTNGSAARTSGFDGSAGSHTTSANGDHYHSFTTGGISANHYHYVSGTTGGRSAYHQHGYSGTTANAGSGTPHNNMPPYLVVYAWKRVA